MLDIKYHPFGKDLSWKGKLHVKRISVAFMKSGCSPDCLDKAMQVWKWLAPVFYLLDSPWYLALSTLSTLTLNEPFHPSGIQTQPTSLQPALPCDCHMRLGKTEQTLPDGLVEGSPKHLDSSWHWKTLPDGPNQQKFLWRILLTTFQLSSSTGVPRKLNVFWYFWWHGTNK